MYSKQEKRFFLCLYIRFWNAASLLLTPFFYEYNNKKSRILCPYIHVACSSLRHLSYLLINIFTLQSYHWFVIVSPPSFTSPPPPPNPFVPLLPPTPHLCFPFRCMDPSICQKWICNKQSKVFLWENNNYLPPSLSPFLSLSLSFLLSLSLSPSLSLSLFFLSLSLACSFSFYLSLPLYLQF